MEFQGQVQTCLPAQPGYDRVRAFIATDSCQVLQRQRFHIHLIRDRMVCHNRGRIRVYENHLAALLLQGKAGLCSGIVKLSGLPDYNRP